MAGLSGSFVSKEIRGRTYWYVQRSEGERKRQIYIGPDSPELRHTMRKASEQRASAREDEHRRRDLVSMLAAAGFFRESAAVATVLQIVAEAGVFRSAGVLVGTLAFRCIANLLGAKFDEESIRTADIDLAQSVTIPVAVDEPEVDPLTRLKAAEPRFFGVPGIDPGRPSTSFKVRGRDLRVDFVTPAKRGGRRAVVLRHLGVAAQPLAGLDYLLGDSIDAVVLAGPGVHVNVPAPARFALHKLWLASRRPAAEQAKARKDRRQGEQLLRLLLEDRPDDVESAYAALEERPRMLRAVRRALAAASINR